MSVPSSTPDSTTTTPDVATAPAATTETEITTESTTTESSPAPADATTATDPILKEGPVREAAEIVLPEEDESERQWHKLTLIEQEDIRERVTIPAAFAEKYLWSPSSSKSTSSSTSTPLSNAVTIPPGLLADAHAAVVNALSQKSQLASLPPKPVTAPTTDGEAATTTAAAASDPPPDPDPAVEPIITLYCPFDNTPGVLDSIVSGLGASQQADVLVLDALMFAQGEVGPLGSELNVFLKKLYALDDATDTEHRSRQVQRYFRALLDVEHPQDKQEAKEDASKEKTTSSSSASAISRPRIIYVRDFGGIASHGQPLLKELILATRSRRSLTSESPETAEADVIPPVEATKTPEPTTNASTTPETTAKPKETPATPVTTAKVLNPTVIVLGVSHSPEATPHNCCSSCTWSRFLEGFESSEADKTMQLLPDILQPTIDATSFKSKDDGDVSKVLADALFTGPKRCGYGGEKTFNDPEVGSGGVYRTIICAYGFTDDRDIPAPDVSKTEDSSKSSSATKPKPKSKTKPTKPDDSIWRKGKATVQRERKNALGEMRLARNGNILRKALDALGGTMPEGVEIFSALPQASPEESVASKEGKKSKNGKSSKKEKKKTKEEIELEKFTTVEGLKDNLLTKTSAERIAAIAMHGLPGGSETENVVKTETSVTTTEEKAGEVVEASVSEIKEDETTSTTTPTSDTTPSSPTSTTLTTTPTSAPTPSPSSPIVKSNPPPSSSPSTASSSRIVSPQSIASAIKASLIGNDQRKKWVEAQQAFKTAADNGTDTSTSNSGDSDKDGEEKKEDPIVAKVRSSGTLNSYEERLLPGVIDTTQLKTSFEDVCIDPKIIDSVRMIISLPLLYPKAFASGILGAEAMSGILLYGPPGTGKTMLCRAIAKECKVRMLLVTPSSVQDMYVGETEKLVKAIFTLARKIAPCVIFIDELDALFGARSSDSTNGSRYHRSMLTEFMQEMDGLSTAGQNKKKGIVVIGATNRPFDLDDAVLRRLPRRMLLDLPGPKEREQILKVHLRGEEMDSIDLTDIARRTNNFSGSDLKNLAVAAALASLKDIIPDMWNAKAKAAQKDKAKDVKTDATMSTEAASGDASGATKTENKSDDAEEEEDEDDEEDDDDDSDDDDSPDVPARILKPAHFKAAFEQVSATCSRDMASVVKLRNWANQFSKDSGAGLGGANGSQANGHANGGHSYRGLGNGDGLGDSRYGSTMLQRLTKPPGGNGSGGSGGF